MAHVRKEAFIWTRQFTHSQLRRLDRVQRACHWLDSKTIDLSRFARCQLQDTDKRYNVYHTFDGVWDGKPAYIEPRLRPLFSMTSIGSVSYGPTLALIKWRSWTITEYQR
jgi:hypothetical protein